MPRRARREMSPHRGRIVGTACEAVADACARGARRYNRGLPISSRARRRRRGVSPDRPAGRTKCLNRILPAERW